MYPNVGDAVRGKVNLIPGSGNAARVGVGPGYRRTVEVKKCSRIGRGVDSGRTLKKIAEIVTK
jgi:hypothetical protein